MISYHRQWFAALGQAAVFSQIMLNGFQSSRYSSGTAPARTPSSRAAGHGGISGMTSHKLTDVFVGVESEFYLKQLTLGTVIGYDNYDSHLATRFLAWRRNKIL